MVDVCLIVFGCLAGLASLFGEVTWLIRRLDRMVAFCPSLCFFCVLVGWVLFDFVFLFDCLPSQFGNR